MRARDLSDAELEALLAGITGHGQKSLGPTVEQLKTVIKAGHQGPLQMVNLLKFKRLAEYPTDHENAEQSLSGEDAYMQYGVVAIAQVMKQGGGLVFANSVHSILIGSSEDWDQVAIMEYPNFDAFLTMVQEPDYKAAVVHRDAGLERTALMVTTSLLPA